MEGATAAAIPLPLTEIDAGELLALLTTEMPPVIEPAVVGAKTTFRFALCPAFRYMGTESPLALKPAPDEVNCEMLTVAFPVLVSTTVCEPLLPTVTLPRFTLAGFAEITPAEL